MLGTTGDEWVATPSGRALAAPGPLAGSLKLPASAGEPILPPAVPVKPLNAPLGIGPGFCACAAAGGGFLLDSWNAFILAAISAGRAPGRIDEPAGGGGAGRRAAVILPSGADEDVMLGGGEKSVVVRSEGSR